MVVAVAVAEAVAVAPGAADAGAFQWGGREGDRRGEDLAEVSSGVASSGKVVSLSSCWQPVDH